MIALGPGAWHPLAPSLMPCWSWLVALAGPRLDLFLVPAMLVAIQAVCLRLLRDTRRALCWTLCSCVRSTCLLCSWRSAWFGRGYISASIYGVFHVFYVKRWITDPEVDSRPALICVRIQRTAWFDRGYKSASVYGEFDVFYVNSWITDPQVDSRPALFQRLLGSTVDTSICVRLRGWSS